MKSNTFGIILYFTIVLLLIISCVILIWCWKHYGIHGMVIGVIVSIFFNLIAIQMLKNIKIYQNGKLQTLIDLLDNLIVTVFLIVLTMIIIIVIVAVINIKIAKKYNLSELTGVFIPIISSATMIISIAILAQ